MLTSSLSMRGEIVEATLMKLDLRKVFILRLEVSLMKTELRPEYRKGREKEGRCHM